MKHKKKKWASDDSRASSCGHKEQKCGCKKCKKHKKHKWKKMDTNQDGQVSHEEFINAAEKKFKKMDTNEGQSDLQRGEKSLEKEEKEEKA